MRSEAVWDAMHVVMEKLLEDNKVYMGNQIQISGTSRCYGKPCIQNDSFNELVPKIKEADCIVFASPLYFWTFEHAAAYYRFIFINYIGFYDRGDASCRRLRAYGWKAAD